MPTENLYSFVDRFPGMRMMCIGDMMLDIFTYGKVDRLSPEAPVPVLKETKVRRMLGGSGNVVANLCSLDCTTLFAGVVGDDMQGDDLRGYLRELGADASMLITQPGYHTSVKTRFVSGSQHLLRVDREERLCLSEEVLAKLLGSIEAQLPGILLNYGVGCEAVIIHARADKPGLALEAEQLAQGRLLGQQQARAQPAKLRALAALVGTLFVPKQIYQIFDVCTRRQYRQQHRCKQQKCQAPQKMLFHSSVLIIG